MKNSTIEFTYLNKTYFQCTFNIVETSTGKITSFKQSYLDSEFNKIKDDNLLNELDEYFNRARVTTEDAVKNILEDLNYELQDCKKPASYQDEDYYKKCDAQAAAYEQAIHIVQRHLDSVNN